MHWVLLRMTRCNEGCANIVGRGLAPAVTKSWLHLGRRERVGFPEVNEMNFGGSRNGGLSRSDWGIVFSDFRIPPPSAPPFAQGRLCVKRVVRTHSVGVGVLDDPLQILIYELDYIFARDSIGHPAGHKVSFWKKSPRDSIVSLCHSGGSATTDRISERTQGLLQNDVRGDSIESRLVFSRMTTREG